MAAIEAQFMLSVGLIGKFSFLHDHFLGASLRRTGVSIRLTGCHMTPLWSCKSNLQGNVPRNTVQLGGGVKGYVWTAVWSPQRKMWTETRCGCGATPLWARTWGRFCSESAAWPRTAGNSTPLYLASSVELGTTLPQLRSMNPLH